MTQTATKERGILMHARSIRNILAGRKAQTRRGDKKRLGDNVVSVEPVPDLPGVFFVTYRYPDRREGVFVETVKCPYGQPGDRLWVRERWRVVGWHEGEPIVIEYADGKREEESGSDAPGYEDWYERMIIQSGEDCEKAGIELDPITEAYTFPESGPVTRWRPSIHMPRWASRITLEITDIRVERVQDISPTDACAEGVFTDEHGEVRAEVEPPLPYPVATFKKLWDDTNGPGAWDRNDWVWVVEFKVVTP